LVNQEVVGALDAEKDRAVAAVKGLLGRYHYSAVGGGPPPGIDGGGIICPGASEGRGRCQAPGGAAQGEGGRRNQRSGSPSWRPSPRRARTISGKTEFVMPRTAFLFPGQGAQAVGMAGPLCQSLPAAHALFQEASAVLGYDLLGVCVNGPADRLNATDVSQPAIFVASLAALEQLKATEPDAANDVVATAGLSLGEDTALVFAGAMSFADGLKGV